jgi:hypothetical protein
MRGPSIKGRCYERDNGYKTHRAKRLGLLQGHYKNDDNLEGIRKRKQEAIWHQLFISGFLNWLHSFESWIIDD